MQMLVFALDNHSLMADVEYSRKAACTYFVYFYSLQTQMTEA
jgi:hypothetical protein